MRISMEVFCEPIADDQSPLPVAVSGGGPSVSRLPEEVMDIDNSSNGETDKILTEGELTEELAMKVFGNDMLREMILNSVIFPDGKLSRTDLKSVRAVQKSWLRTAADTLRKCRLPTFVLTLDKDNSVYENPFMQEPRTKLLDNFVRSMTAATRLTDFIPTFSLKLMPEFFRAENYKNLSDCLIHCGEALIDLELIFPINSSMTFVFPTFYLPQLQHLAVQFSDQRLQILDLAMGPVIHNNSHTIYPLQTILNGTDELKELDFKYTPSEALIPFGFEYLVLPETITKLSLDCPLKDSDMQLLIKNNLPHLDSLRLFATNVPYSDEMIYNILEKYSKILRTLCLRGHHYHGRVQNTTLFRFPVMEKLETITVTSQCWELEDDLSNLERQLPKLKELRMLNSTDGMFYKWTENSRYELVERLFVSLINVNVTSFHPHHVEVPMTITLEKMQTLHLSFPNVVCLEMAMWGPQCCGIKYLFMEMRSLQKLAITIKGAGNQFHPVHWDSLLIGVPPDMVVSLRKNRDYWDMVELKDDNNFPSIRKLTALKSLALVETVCPASAGDPRTPFISDLSFHFAFLKMPNLSNLLLHGRFSPSPQMAERWKREKGVEIHGIRQGFK